MSLEDNLQAVMAATHSADPHVQAAAVGAATTATLGAVPPPSAAEAGLLWKALTAGLLLLALVSLVGVFYAVAAGKDGQVLVTIFSSVLSGLIGLFVKSPMQ